MPDRTIDRIEQGVELGESGDAEGARMHLGRLWDSIGGESGDPLHRCLLAHALADLQDDPRDELMWDRRALDAAEVLTDERLAAAGIDVPAAGFYPSLHLNLGECYRRVGDLDRAREHALRGRATVDVLDDDSYGRMVRHGLDRLADLLEV